VQSVLLAQGIPDTHTVQTRYGQVAEQAIALYSNLAHAEGVFAEIASEEFAAIYEGEGKNECPAPLEQVYPLGHDLALFAVTVGEPVCREIARLFAQNEFALGSMLDAAASEGTELAATFAEKTHVQHLKDRGEMQADSGYLRFSPGYCGWDLGAQKKLFEALQPQEIGITLNPSFLMQPLKSITGVFVVGPRAIFAFEDAYAFCNACDTHSCRDRLKMVAERP
jgi:hypothetical protein